MNNTIFLTMNNEIPAGRGWIDYHYATAVSKFAANSQNIIQHFTANIIEKFITLIKKVISVFIPKDRIPVSLVTVANRANGPPLYSSLKNKMFQILALKKVLGFLCVI